MNKLLFVSSGLMTSSTSAAIRNRRLVGELVKYFDVCAIDISPRGSSISHEIEGAHGFLVQSGVYSTENIGFSEENNFLFRVRQWLKSFVRCVVPDKYSIELLLYDFSSVFSDVPVFDVVLTSSDPKGVHACLFNSSFRKRFIGGGTKIIEYWGDPWYGDINFHTNGITRCLERKIFSRADDVVFNSLATYSEKSDGCKGISRFHFLSRGVNGNVNELPDTLHWHFDSVRLLYAGDYFSVSRNLSPLINAVNGLDVYLSVVGDGDFSGPVPANVKLSGRVDPGEVQCLMCDTDVLIVLLNRAGGQIPGKLYDYASSDRPVVVLYDDERLLEHIPFFDRFVFVRNEESAIREFFRTTTDFYVNFGSVKKASFSEEVFRFLEEVDLVKK